MNTTPFLLITGATGANGQLLLQELSRAGVPTRAMVRPGSDTSAIRDLPGVSLVEGDFNDRDSLQRALEGVERAFLLTNSSERAEEQQLSFVEFAQQSGVRHLAKLSQLAASATSPVRFLRYHAAVEAAIEQSGMAFTFLRPNLYMQGLLMLASMIQSQGKIYAPIGDTPISLIDVRDIARVAYHVLTEPGHDGKTYTLTGPAALTHREIATELTAALGKEVTFVDITSEQFAKFLSHTQMPSWQAEGLVEDYVHYKRGEASLVTSTVQDITGTTAISFADFTLAYRDVFLQH